MPAKIDATRLAERVRANQRTGQRRRRERLAAAGLTQIAVWIPETTRKTLDSIASDFGMTLSMAAQSAIEAGLDWQLAKIRERVKAAGITPPDPEPERDIETLDMFEISQTQETASPLVSVESKAALMAEVEKLLDAGLSGNEVAKRLNAAGYRTASGRELIGANLLRDYRKYQQTLN